MLLSASSCVPQATETLRGTDTVDSFRSRFGRSFMTHFPGGGAPVFARVDCVGVRVDGDLQIVAISAHVEVAGSGRAETGTDRESPPWTPNLFGGAKLAAHAEVPIACDEPEGGECERRINVECAFNDSIIPGTRVELEWRATVSTRANLVGSAPGLTLVEVPPG